MSQVDLPVTAETPQATGTAAWWRRLLRDPGAELARPSPKSHQKCRFRRNIALTSQERSANGMGITQRLPNKKPLGLGRNVRSEAEFLIWGARRGARAPEMPSPRQVHEWKKPKRHSEKPAAAYTFIKSLSDGPRLDIFARQSRPGFEAWGNQADRLDDPQAAA